MRLTIFLKLISWIRIRTDLPLHSVSKLDPEPHKLNARNTFRYSNRAYLIFLVFLGPLKMATFGRGGVGSGSGLNDDYRTFTLAPH
jgi:hypothetical protein